MIREGGALVFHVGLGGSGVYIEQVCYLRWDMSIVGHNGS